VGGWLCWQAVVEREGAAALTPHSGERGGVAGMYANCALHSTECNAALLPSFRQPCLPMCIRLQMWRQLSRTPLTSSAFQPRQTSVGAQAAAAAGHASPSWLWQSS
jgi:hypothetical protein